ncbi:hypothetical protein BST61_g9631 [Cercospora zeina]
MADEAANTGRANSPPRARRSSFAGETFANLFSGGRSGGISRTTSEYNGSQQPYNGAGPITSAAAQAQRRRLSLTTLGLSASPGQASPFGSYNSRRDSYGTAASDSIDESAIEEDDGKTSYPTPATPFARRMSFGAKALRDVRTGNSANGGGGGSPPNGSEGFNWSDNFRSRAERTSSIAGGSLFNNNNAGPSPPMKHDRSKSVAVMEPPAREMPKPKEQVRPDHFQERILKGDFYMD